MNDDDEPIYSPNMAREVVRRAVLAGEEAKLLNLLSDGGAATIDIESDRNFYATSEQLAQLCVMELPEVTRPTAAGGMTVTPPPEYDVIGPPEH